MHEKEHLFAPRSCEIDRWIDGEVAPGPRCPDCSLEPRSPATRLPSELTNTTRMHRSKKKKFDVILLYHLFRCFIFSISSQDWKAVTLHGQVLQRVCFWHKYCSVLVCRPPTYLPALAGRLPSIVGGDKPARARLWRAGRMWVAVSPPSIPSTRPPFALLCLSHSHWGYGLAMKSDMIPVILHLSHILYYISFFGLRIRYESFRY